MSVDVHVGSLLSCYEAAKFLETNALVNHHMSAYRVLESLGVIRQSKPGSGSPCASKGGDSGPADERHGLSFAQEAS